METSIRILSEAPTFSKRLKRAICNHQGSLHLFINLLLIVEIATFILLCNKTISNYLYTHSEMLKHVSILNDTTFMILNTILILAVQLYYDVSLIKLCYLRCFYAFQFADTKKYFLIIITVLCLVIDFCKTSTTLVYFRNKWAQPYNEFKLGIYVLNLTAVACTEFKVDSAYPVLLGMYAIFYGLRLKYPMVEESSNFYNEVLLLFGVMLMVFSTIEAYWRNVELLYQLIGISSIFLIHLYMKRRFFSSNIKNLLTDLKDLHQKQKFVEAFKHLIVYLQKFEFDQKQDSHIRQFLNATCNVSLPVLTMTTRNEYLAQIYKLYTKSKDIYQHSLDYSIILAQLEVLANKNITNLLHIQKSITLIQYSSIRSWVIKIQLGKLQQFIDYTIYESHENQHRSKSSRINVQSFMENILFIEIVSQSVRYYEQLWKGIAEGVQSRSELETKLDKLIYITKLTQQRYAKLNVKSRYSSLLYNNYLKLVHKDRQLKRVIQLDWECSKAVTEDCMVYYQTLFICLRMDGQILQIGENCLGLFGFKHQEVINDSILRILPKFGGTHNCLWIEEFMNNSYKNEAIQHLLPQFLVDDYNHLKMVRFDLDVKLINDQLLLVGSIKIEKNIKHIIVFDEKGQIMLTSNFMGELDSKHIHQQDKTFDQITKLLEAGQILELSINVNYISVTNTYKLHSVITKQDPQDNIYIIINTVQQQYEKGLITTATIPKSSQSIDKIKQSKIEIDKLSIFKQKMVEKYQSRKVFIRCILLLLSTIFLLILSVFFSVVIQNRTSQKFRYATTMKTIQISSMKSIYFVGATFYVALEVNQNVTFASFQSQQVAFLRQLIIETKQSIFVFTKISQNLLSSQTFQRFQFDTKTLLMLSAMMVHLDFILLDKQYYDPLRYLGFVRYSEKNMEILINDILPKYQTQLIAALSETIQFYRNTYMITLILTIIFVVIQAISLILFDKKQKTEMLSIDNALMEINDSQLKQRLSNIQKFKNMIYCVDKSDRLKQNNDNQQKISCQIQKDEVMNVISSSVQSTRRQLIGNMSPTLSVSPGSSSINEFTTDHVMNLAVQKPVELIQYEPKPQKYVRKLETVAKNYCLYFVIIFLTAGVSINMGLYYQFSKTPQYPSLQYLKSFISLKGTFYQYQSLHSYLFQNIYSNFAHMDLLKEALYNFSTATNNLKDYNYVLFEPHQFDYFRQFKRALDFDSMCTLINCELYPDKLNSTYMTSVTNAATMTEKIYNASLVSPPSISQLIKDFDLDYLIYSNRLFLEIFIDLFESGLNGLVTHFQEISKISYIRMAVQYGLIGSLLFVDVIMIVLFVKEKKRILGLLRLLREDQQTNLKF